jgi:mono/diheme cytochrome c family protein
MKKLALLTAVLISALILSCGGETKKQEENSQSPTATGPESNVPDYDPKRGEGKFDESNVKLGPLDEAMAAKGEAISGTKCTSCHKLTDEKLVGPGWKGVTTRKTAHWIMNFITNPDPMIDKDPEVQAQLELCLVRMPNQSLADEDARQIVEFMRKNDSSK